MVNNGKDIQQLQQTQNNVDSLDSNLGEIGENILNLSDAIQNSRDFSLSVESDLSSLKSDLNQENQSVSSGLDLGEESMKIDENVKPTPSTCELLEGTDTFGRIENIISNNQEIFVNVPGNTAKEKVEYIFNTIRNAASEFLKDKLGNSMEAERVISNTIVPALEWNLLNLLTVQGRDKNEDMLDGLNKIAFDGLTNFGRLTNLFGGVKKFAGVEKDEDEPSEVYVKISGWMNAIDYLAVQEKKFGILNYAENSDILTNPLKFQTYLNDDRFSSKDFSAYENVGLNDLYNLFGINQNEKFNFGISGKEAEEIKKEIGDIKVESVDSVSLVSKLVGKSENFLKKTPGLQRAANHLLDGVNSINNITKKILNVDILGEFSKPPEKRGILYKLLDFVCKLIGITGGLDGIVKNWRLDRLNLGNKTENIVKIFEAYSGNAKNGESVSVVDEASCMAALDGFKLTDPTKTSTTKGDFLRDAMVNNMDISLLSVSVVKETLGDSYLKKETVKENGKTKEKLVVNTAEIIANGKIQELAQKHVFNMKVHLEKYKDNDLKDFYSKVHSTDDIATCMIASLYANKEDVVEGVKAEVFLPESYRRLEFAGMVLGDAGGRENLDDSVDTSDKCNVSRRWVYDKAVEYGITDNRQIAYVLSTIQGESGFKNQKEIGGEDRSYGKVDAETGKAYYGRGFIQITHKDNYRRYSQIIRNSGRDFKDNDGNIIRGTDVDLVNNPDIILQSNDLAIFIAMDWMKNGGPYRAENKRLDYYINDNKLDYYNARIIINGMGSKPQEYANNAQTYLEALSGGSTEKQPESKDGIFMGPELLAHSKDEIGGIGNSIMAGFQGYRNKFNFPNMDGEESKNTQTHPHRFNSPLDVQQYKAEHQGVRSFMFYFGANTSDNAQTLSDITRWSERFQEEGIQPVLCTCIGEDRHTWLSDLNKSLIDLGQRKNWPVFDFAKIYNKGDIAMGGGDSPHPTSEGYSKMASLINEQIKPT